MAAIEELGIESAGLENQDYWSALSQTHWQKARKPGKVRSDVIKKEIWDVLEVEDFALHSLLQLESLQILENYLWPGYHDDSINHHVLLIAFLVATKSHANVPAWDLFSDDLVRFSSLFRRVLSISLDTSVSTKIRTHLLSFLLSAFQSLDNGLIRRECAPLVSISTWHNLSSEAARERRFEEHTQLRKAWRASTKRYEAAEEDIQAKLRFERSWLYTLLLDFISRLWDGEGEDVTYCERFLEFLTDLESQLPTRRYVNTLLQDMNLLAVLRLSPMFNNQGNGLLRDLFILFRHFVNFPIDDNTGTQYSKAQAYEKHYEKLARLQRVALKSFKSKLTILALSNYGAIDKRNDLESQLSDLTDQELHELCSLLGYRTLYPVAVRLEVNRTFFIEVLVQAYERRKTFQEAIRDLTIQPTETELYDESLVRNETYDGAQSLAIPKLNLQYLSVGDFLWRSFILYRCEQFFEIRKYLEDIIKRLQPEHTNSGPIRFGGFSKLALPISKPAILEAAPPKVGYDKPAYVRAEIVLNVSKLADTVVRDWDSLRPEDVIYLLAVRPTEDSRDSMNGQSDHKNPMPTGFLTLRTAEVVQVLDEHSRPLREHVLNEVNGYGKRPRMRRLLVNLDPVAFRADTEFKDKGKPDVYESLNVIVRRSQRENNWKRVLETIQRLALSDVPMPGWLQEVFLGYGDPTSASYTRLENRIEAVDFQDTFIDWDHLVESFPGRVIEMEDEGVQTSGPPFVLRTSKLPAESAPRSSRKRRRNEDAPPQQTAESIGVSTYKSPPNGPYPIDVPNKNRVRFTPIQVEAIESGTQPGLTVVVGPPGTGKTDVATQIINNIYHDFPSQRTLLIAHSNQALNQLFQKIMALDIDGRHLLRLGQGEGDLESAESFSKYGRVESFLDNRAYLLAEVNRLATNFGAPGAHGSSCETAGYFNLVYVHPAWSRFWDTANNVDSTSERIREAFPFHHYFQNTPEPLFPPNASKDEIIEVIKGCENHITKIFTSLEDIRPFEILRSNKDRTNYLMVKEARIIAMTTTHAAMRRQEIADLGFHYDNVIMEEAAQITEIESFIPLAMQKSQAAELPLQRVVLCGDHLQNSPIIQNMAFRQFANLEQSLFLRFVRLGVPTITLDHQGRARPSIAKLYRWRYPDLKNLPNVSSKSEYLQANAGFKYEYQFIDVPDYKGVGEAQPSPHFYQNLGEAEYAVAIYQYMRLLGYSASSISILTMYAGQRALIRDVLGHRCAKNRLFGLPRLVTTVDKYQGEQNDYIILSLTRTRQPGYLRDTRRLTVALSRARLGLYILGRRSVFQSLPEFAEAFTLPMQRPEKLQLTTGETFPTQRLLEAEVESTEMAGVEHLGQYVFEMTQAKVEMLRKAGTALPPQDADMDVANDEEQGEVDALVEAEEEPEEPEGLGDVT
ncbi:hypothetical protein ACLMJK_004524 [Lecanora helva]